MTNKLFIENPYLREIDATIIEKKYRNNKYYIKLNRTIFYPHLSGGQPRDKGTINNVQVVEVYEDGDDIIHVTNDNINSTDVRISIDWDNRLDLMQQHSGQHLLSSAFYKLFNGDTIGFYIGKEHVSIDINIPELSYEEVEQVELLANRIIYSNFQIKSYYVDDDKINTLNLRNAPSVTSNIRIVEIDSFDFSPCGGTHLRNTGEIGIIKITKWEKYKGNIRVEFLCGNRALKDYIWKNKYIKDLSLMLSSKDTDVLNNVQRLIDEKEELNKENRSLREQVYTFKGQDLLNSGKIINHITYIVKEFNNIDIKEINLISLSLKDHKKLVQIYSIINNDKAQFMINISKDSEINMKDIFQEISKEFEIKGGGSPHSVQGRTSLDDLDRVIKLFYNKIRNQNKG